MIRRMIRRLFRRIPQFRISAGLLSPTLEIGGAILIVAGIGLWSVPLALVVAGAACIFLAQGMEARG